MSDVSNSRWVLALLGNCSIGLPRFVTSTQTTGTDAEGILQIGEKRTPHEHLYEAGLELPSLFDTI